ncbi:MAG: hypothetical protein ACKPKO_09750, partial [Candidatus Fonsibacter sp.]
YLLEEDINIGVSTDGVASVAAPAARKRLPYSPAVARLLFMSWNAGGGARLLPQVLKEKGYHLFAIQEAHEDQMAQLGDTDSFVLQAAQCIVVRKPIEVCTIAPHITYKIMWHVAEVHFVKPR